MDDQAPSVKPKEDEDKVLKLVNKVQMFQIAVSKVNKKCTAKKKEPVFAMAKNGQSARNQNFEKFFED
jgi:hypothetical protein